MNIRLCRPEDAERWIALNKEFMIYEISDENLWDHAGKVPDSVFEYTFSDALKNPDLITMFIFEEDGEAIGFASIMTIYSIWAHGKSILLDDLFITEAYRGMGHGKTAMEYIEDYARKNGYKRLEFLSKPSNEGSKMFYRALGYKCDDYYFYVKYLSG